MLGCGLIVAIVAGILVCVFITSVTGSFLFGLIAGLLLFGMIGGTFVGAQGDVNRATQHYRDQEIIDAIKDLKDKE